MSVTIDPPRVAPPNDARRRVPPLRLVVCLVAALAAVAVLVGVVTRDSGPPAAFDAVWLEPGYDDNDRDVRLVAWRASGERVYVPGQVLAPFEDNDGDLARDGRHYAYLPSSLGLRIVTLPDPEVRVVTVPKGATLPVWSPDVRTIALSGGRRDAMSFHLVDVATGAVRTVLYPYEGGPLSWSPDGTTLALSGADGVHLVRPDGTLVRRIPGYGVSERHAWSADGTRLLLTTQGGLVAAFVFDAATGRRLFGLAAPLMDVTWTADGGLVQVSTHEIRYYDAHGRLLRTERTGYAGHNHASLARAIRPAV